MLYFVLCFLSQMLVATCGESSTNSLKWRHLPKECGGTRLDNQTVRIIDGDQAALGQFPWAARIGKYRKSGTAFFYCGGSLINKYYVLSAAHCREGSVVRLGENDVGSKIDCDRSGICAPPHQDIKIKEYKSLDFQNTTQRNDLALIQLERPVEFNDFVQPICLPRAPIPHQELIDMTVSVAGWGLVSNELLTLAKHLMYVQLPIVDSKECNDIYPLPLIESQICIGHVEGGKDSCQGDSGGPASMSRKVDGERRIYLIGVVSYGLTMCGLGVAVYTDVSYFIDWILDSIEKS